MAVPALALGRVGSLPRASGFRGASHVQPRKGGPSSCRLFCLRQTTAKLGYNCKLSCKNSSHDSTTSYDHAVPCCLHNKHINVHWNTPMNGSYILTHARLLSTWGLSILNLPRASEMLRPALTDGVSRWTILWNWLSLLTCLLSRKVGHLNLWPQMPL